MPGCPAFALPLGKLSGCALSRPSFAILLTLLGLPRAAPCLQR